MLVGLLTGCSAGSTVETKLTINNDLSGSRVMELVINQSVFNEYFSGSIESLNAAITESCPSQLNWTYDASTGSKIYKFTLDFSSPEDYQNKVNALLGEGSEETVEITQADSVWANGVIVKESFSSSDLLGWLKTMVVNKGFVSSSNSSKLFQLGGTTVLYRGEEYSASSTININKMEYLDIDNIYLLTDVNAYDSYNKTIVLHIPADSMTKKGDEIKAWLAERVPEGATATWTEEKDENGELKTAIYTVKKEFMSGEELQKFLNHFFASELCVVEQSKVTEDKSPFVFMNNLAETIDFSNYVLSNRTYYTDIYSYVIGTSGYGAGRYTDDLGDGTPSEYNDSDEYPGYKRTSSEYIEDTLRKYSSVSLKAYKVKAVNVESNVGLFGDFNKEYTFTLAVEPSDAEKEEIINKIQSYGVVYAELKAALEASKEESTESDSNIEMDSTELSTEEGTTEESTEKEEEFKPEWDVEIKDETKDGIYSITIKQKGDREELVCSSTALFGSAPSCYVTSGYGFASLSYPVAVYDGYYVGHFVDYCTDDVTGTYTLNTGLGSSIEYTNVEEAVVEGSKVTVTGASAVNGLSIIAYGSQLNIWAILFYLLFIGGVACVVIVLKKEGILDELLAKLPKKAPAVQAPVEEVPMFCENCGAPRDADACVCTQCGTKFSE